MSHIEPVAAPKAPASDPFLPSNANKIRNLGLFLIGLAVLTVAATVLIAIKFHSYKPLSPDYHYLGLSIIIAGGVCLTIAIVYKGIISIKEANPKYRKDRFDEFIAVMNDGEAIVGFQSACKKFPNHIKKGFIPIKPFNEVLAKILMQENFANTFADTLAGEFGPVEKIQKNQFTYFQLLE